MKGRIIGRDGRNIRALEKATGVDLIIDDTPDAVTLSCFDPVRREIARVALNRLVDDGRIHPTRIEEVVEKARPGGGRSHQGRRRAGGDRGRLSRSPPGDHQDAGPPEVPHQLRPEPAPARRGDAPTSPAARRRDRRRRQRLPSGALLHDLGKAIDHEVEGTHALIGAELARRFGVSPTVVHCIAAHHEEEELRTVEAIIVQIADAISGSRPGRALETLEHYIKRLEALETLASGFEGVEKAFAIQAGREIRIIVKPEEMDDLASMRLARDISRRIEESLEYPGQIKVTVVRETRAVDYAK